VRPKVEAFQDLADAHPFVDEPAVHRANEVSFRVIDDQVAWHAFTLEHVAVAIRRPTAQVLAGSRPLQLAATEPLSEQRSLVFGDGALDLEEELVARIFADGPMDKDDLATGALKLLEE
jgi:hypothetical protein